ncbi:MAG: TolC family protein [Ferruginibacter sp.]|nr:TolC family protein [Cytophagales bacterium]
MAQTQPTAAPTTDSTGRPPATPPAGSYSLRQALDYALANNLAIKNAQTDITSAAARVGEIRSTGLPQINVDASLTHNLQIQKVILETGTGSPFGDPNTPPGSVLAFPFQLKNNGLIAASASQILFDGSYFVGLKAAKTYQELSRKAVIQSKIDVAESVTKAYYSVLVNEERLNLLSANVNRLDSLLRETRAQFQNGFVEKIDADRIEVQFNNVKVDQQRTGRLVELSKYLLQFQMGLPVKDSIALTDRLDQPGIENLVVPEEPFQYSQRVDYSTLQTQRELGLLDIRNGRAGYLPRLTASATYGYNPAATEFRNLTQFDQRWFSYSFVGLNLHIPIFDGFQKRYKIQQSRLTSQKTDQSLVLLANNIDLQIQQARITLTNGVDALKTQRRNLELAREVVRVTKIKYQQGVGSNIEVVNAETDYKEAQNNYYAALYDTLVAKVDLDKATGKLIVE